MSTAPISTESASLPPTVKKRSDKAAKRSSTLVSILIHALLLLIGLYVVVFQSSPKEEVSFLPPDPQRPNLEPRKLEMKVRVNQLTKRSSRPRLQPRMMVNAPSDLSLPEIKHDPKATRNKVQRTFKTMGTSGFGAGIGGGYGMGMGGGMGGMGVNFMGAESTGSRFAFVIDYSKSMKPIQQAVVKNELYKALENIGGNGMATVLFFSGPVWRPDQDAVEVRDDWEGSNGKGWFLKEGEEGPNPRWFYPDTDNLKAMERMIYQTPTTFGTDWYHPLKFVLEMEPPPDVVFFMTDGNVPTSSSEKTLKMVEDLQEGNIVIHTVVLGLSEQRAEPLKTISEITKGDFRNYTQEELADMNSKLPEPPTTFSSKSIDYLEEKKRPGMWGPLGPRSR